MKNGIILSLIIFLVVLLIIGCSIKIRHFPEGANDKTCSIDSDCVISVATESKDNCCFECDVESINTNAERIRDEWSNKNCGNWQDECPIYDCRSLKNPKAVCISNICQIEWVERISNDAYSVEEFNSIQKEYQKVYSVVGYISELDTK